MTTYYQDPSTGVVHSEEVWRDFIDEMNSHCEPEDAETLESLIAGYELWPISEEDAKELTSAE